MRTILAVAVFCLLAGSGIGFELSSAMTTRLPPPPVGVARYADGLKHLDGEEIWGGMSPYLQDKIVQGGDTHTSFVNFYTQMRAKPTARIDEVQYVGGYQAKDKGYFIYVTRHLEAGKEPIEVMWVFLTDANGLIDFIL